LLDAVTAAAHVTQFMSVGYSGQMSRI